MVWCGVNGLFIEGKDGYLVFDEFAAGEGLRTGATHEVLRMPGLAQRIDHLADHHLTCATHHASRITHTTARAPATHKKREREREKEDGAITPRGRAESGLERRNGTAMAAGRAVELNGAPVGRVGGHPRDARSARCIAWARACRRSARTCQRNAPAHPRTHAKNGQKQASRHSP